MTARYFDPVQRVGHGLGDHVGHLLDGDLIVFGHGENDRVHLVVVARPNRTPTNANGECELNGNPKGSPYT